MFKAFFGLKEQPFSLSPDPAFLYRSPQHEEALANLIYGIDSRKGFVVLTGEVGTGKTTLLECLIDYLEERGIVFGFVFNPRLTPDQFFELIANDLSLNCPANSKAAVLLALRRMAIERAARNTTLALIVDEAHDLSWELLEEIRLLGNLENRTGKLLQIVLAGQPELDRRLDAPELRQLKQRIALRRSLSPLEKDQTAEYICQRLAKAGLENQKIFSPDLMEEIHKRSRGIPRLINILCDNLLLTAFALESRTATLEMLEEVASDLRLADAEQG